MFQKNPKTISNFALNPCDSTLKQFNECCSCDFVIKASLMPDAHKGYIAPIGSVFLSKDYIVPAWIGYDIGCGVVAFSFKSKGILTYVKENLDLIYDKLREKIPMGKGRLNHIQNISLDTRNKFKKLLSKFKEGRYQDDIYKLIKNKALSNLGTLGDGNHFIELCYEEEKENGEEANVDEVWLVVHSGSRGIGHKLAEIYMKKAAKSEKNYEKTSALKYDSDLGKEYLNVLDFALNFALLNRLEMVNKFKEVLDSILALQTKFEKKVLAELWVNKNHNHAITGDKEGLFIHRKGATPAAFKERGIIPGNMRDGSFLVEGLGNSDFLESSSHGAGRIYSRTKAKKEISMDEFKKSMNGICGSVSFETLDEAPAAYKNINSVMEVQKDSVKIVKHLLPLINWKGF